MNPAHRRASAASVGQRNVARRESLSCHPASPDEERPFPKPLFPQRPLRYPRMVCVLLEVTLRWDRRHSRNPYPARGSVPQTIRTTRLPIPRPQVSPDPPPLPTLSRRSEKHSSQPASVRPSYPSRKTTIRSDAIALYYTSAQHRFVKLQLLAPSLAGAFVACAVNVPPPVPPQAHRRSRSEVGAGPFAASRSARGKGRRVRRCRRLSAGRRGGGAS